MNPRVSNCQKVTRNIFKTTLAVVGILLCLAIPAGKDQALAANGIAEQINYQGKLLTPLGAAVPAGTYSVVFSLYDAESGGSRIWTAGGSLASPTAVNVEVTSEGLFTVLLGSGSQNSLDNVDWNSDSIYLGVTVGSDSEMSPRKRLVAAPQAFNAAEWNGYRTATSIQSGSELLKLSQLSADVATSDRTTLLLTTSGTSNLYDYLLKANNGTSDVFTISRQGNVTTTGSFYAGGTASLQNLVFTNATGASLYATNGSFGTLTATTLAPTNITWVNATGTNTTSTNLFASNLGFGTASGSMLSVTTLAVSTSTDLIAGSAIGINDTLVINPSGLSSSASYYAAFATADYIASVPTNSGYYVVGSFNIGRNSGISTLENVVGTWGRAENASSGVVNDSQGVVGQSRNSGTGTILRGYGVVGASRNNSTGVVTNAVGVYGDIINFNAGGVITNAYNIKAATPFMNAGTIDNLYGVYIDSQSPPGGGTILNKWALYQASSTDRSYFAGYVGFGTSTPNYPVEIIGVVSSSGGFYTPASIYASGTLNGGALSISGSSTLNGLTWVNATGTNTTSTNVYATNLQFTNATGSNLYITTFTAGMLNATGITWTNATGTNTTSTNLYASNLLFNGATGSNVNITGGLVASTGTITNLNFLNATGTNLFVQGAMTIGTGTSTPAQALTFADGGNILLNGGGITSPYGGFGRFENYLTWTEAFDNAAWTKENGIAVTANGQASPSGLLTADTVTTGGSAATDGVIQAASGSPATISSTWTGSVWLKTTAGTSTVNLRISSGNETGTASPVTVTTSWQRVWVTQAFSAGSIGTATFRIETGAGTGIVLWGAQLEKQSTPGAYLTTTSFAVTNTYTGLASAGSPGALFDIGGGGPKLLFGWPADYPSKTVHSIRTCGAYNNNICWDLASVSDFLSIGGRFNVGSGGETIGYDISNFTPPANGLAVSGNVGIGTSAPNYPLEIVGVASSSGGFYTGANVYASGTLNGGMLNVSGSSTLHGVTWTSATGTNTTSTNFYASNLLFSGATGSTVNATGITAVTSTITNVNFVNATGTQLSFTNATGSSLYASSLIAANGIITNLTTIALSATGITWTNATGTNTTSTNLYAQRAYVDFLTSTGTFLTVSSTSITMNGRVDAYGLNRWFQSPLLAQSLMGFGNNATSIAVGSSPVSGIAFDGSSMWVMGATGTVGIATKIDTRTNRIVATVPVPGATSEAAFDGTYLWVTNDDTGTSINKIDVRTNQIVATTTIGWNTLNIAFDGSSMWVANFNSNSVSKVDIGTNAVVATTTVGSLPEGMTFDGSYMWVASYGSSTIFKIDPRTNAVVATTTVGANPRFAAFDGAYVWVTNSDSNNVMKIDAQTNQVVATIPVPHPWGIAFDGSSMWVVNAVENSVTKIDVRTNAVVATYPTGSNPRNIAFDGSSMWVISSVSNDVTKIPAGGSGTGANFLLHANLAPDTNNYWNLGSASNSWSNVYASGTASYFQGINWMNATGTNTTSTNFFASNLNFANAQGVTATSTNLYVNTQARLPSDTLIGGKTVCLSDNTNCPAGVGGGGTTWTDVASGYIYPATSSRSVAIGSGATTTAPFVFDVNAAATPLLIIGKGASAGLQVYGSSTLATVNFTNATGTSIYVSTGIFGTICLTGDTCITSWPTGGGGFIPQLTQVINAGSSATSTPSFDMGFTATTGVITGLTWTNATGTNLYASRASVDVLASTSTFLTVSSTAIEMNGRVDAYGLNRWFQEPMTARALTGLGTSATSIPVGPGYPRGSGQRGMAFDGNNVWVVNNSWDGNSISKIDTRTNAVVATTTLGTNPYGAAFDGTYLWVGNFSDNNLSKIDVRTNAVVATVPVSYGPRFLAFDGRYLWVTLDSSIGSVEKVDVISNQVVATTTVETYPTAITFDGSYVWVATFSSGNLNKVDIRTNAVVAMVAIGDGHDYGSIFFDGSAIWVAMDDGTANVVKKVDPKANAVVATIPVGPNPNGLAYDGEYVWVANNGSNYVSKIDPRTNAVVATSTVGLNPGNLMFDGVNMWVVNYGSNTVTKLPTGGGSTGADFLLHANLMPDVNNAYNLGSASNSWANIYASGTIAGVNAIFTNATATTLGFTNATGTAIYASTGVFGTICLTGDTCITSWPTGGGGFIPQLTQVINAGSLATSTPSFGMGFTATTGVVTGLTWTNATGTNLYASRGAFDVISSTGTFLTVSSTSITMNGRVDAYGLNRWFQIPALLQLAATTTGLSGVYALGFDGTYLWISYGSELQKLDIRTGAVVASIAVTDYPTKFLFDGTYLWGLATAGTPPRIMKIDVRSNTIVASTTAIAVSQFSDLAYDGTSLWATCANTSTGDFISIVNPNTLALVATTTAPGNPTGITFDGTYMWTTAMSGGTVLKIDAATRALIGSYGGSVQPIDAAFDGTSIWVADYYNQTASVVKYNAQTGAVVSTLPASALGLPVEVLFDGTSIWVRLGQGLEKIDPKTNAVLEQFSLPDTNSMTFDGSNIWIRYGGWNGYLRRIPIGGGTTGDFTVHTNISPDQNNTFDLGTASTSFRNIYASGTIAGANMLWTNATGSSLYVTNLTAGTINGQGACLADGTNCLGTQGGGASATLGLHAASVVWTSATTVRVTYDWSDASQLLDWTPTTGATLTRGTSTVDITGGSTDIHGMKWVLPIAASDITASAVSHNNEHHVNIYTNLNAAWAGSPWNANPTYAAIWNYGGGKWVVDGADNGFVSPDLVKDNWYNFEFQASSTLLRAWSTVDSTWHERSGTYAPSTSGYVALGGFGGENEWGAVVIEGAVSTTRSLDFTVRSNAVPNVNNAWDLGSATGSWRNIYASGTIFGANASFTNATATNLSVTGNLTNLITAESLLTQISDTFYVDHIGQWSMKVQGTYAYIYGGYGDSATPFISVVDISDPANPVEIATSSVSGVSTGGSLTINGKYAYALHGSPENFISTIDISNPLHPVEIATMALHSPDRMVIRGSLAFVTELEGGAVYVLDLSDPVHPKRIGYVDVDGPYAEGITVSGRYAYIASVIGAYGVSVVDLSNPASPVVVSKLSTAIEPNFIAASGRYLYVTQKAGNAIAVLDATDPARVVQVATTTAGTNLNDIAISGRYAYCGFEGGVNAFDISSSTHPVLVASSTVVGAGTGSINVIGRNLLAIHGRSLLAMSIPGIETSSLLAHSLEAGTLNVRGEAMVGSNLSVHGGLTVENGIVSQGSLAVNGNITNILTSNSSFQTLSTTSLNTTPRSVAIQGKYAYITDYSTDRLTVYDISDPAFPKSVGYVAVGGINPEYVIIQGRYAYVSTLGTEAVNPTIAIVDVSNPSAPVVTSSTNIGIGISSGGFAVQGQVIYVADQTNNQIRVLDVSNPYSPSIVGTLSMGAGSAPKTSP